MTSQGDCVPNQNQISGFQHPGTSCIVDFLELQILWIRGNPFRPGRWAKVLLQRDQTSTLQEEQTPGSVSRVVGDGNCGPSGT